MDDPCDCHNEQLYTASPMGLFCEVRAETLCVMQISFYSSVVQSYFRR